MDNGFNNLNFLTSGSTAMCAVGSKQPRQMSIHDLATRHSCYQICDSKITKKYLSRASLKISLVESDMFSMLDVYINQELYLELSLVKKIVYLQYTERGEAWKLNLNIHGRDERDKRREKRFLFEKQGEIAPKMQTTLTSKC